MLVQKYCPEKEIGREEEDVFFFPVCSTNTRILLCIGSEKKNLTRSWLTTWDKTVSKWGLTT